MRTTKLARIALGLQKSGVAALLVTAFLSAERAAAADLRVLRMGLGSGTVTSSPGGINCGAACDQSYPSATTVTLTATPTAGSSFTGWAGDCSGTGTCTVTMSAARSVRAEFSLTMAIPPLTAFSPAAIQSYLTANPSVNDAARFVKALPSEL